MKKYYIEIINDDGDVICETDWFNTKDKAKKWLSSNLSFQNGYSDYVEIVVCENKTAKTDKEFFNSYDCIETIKIY